jgi:hypothetical protein
MLHVFDPPLIVGCCHLILQHKHTLSSSFVSLAILCSKFGSCPQQECSPSVLFFTTLFRAYACFVLLSFFFSEAWPCIHICQTSKHIPLKRRSIEDEDQQQKFNKNFMNLIARSSCQKINPKMSIMTLTLHASFR